MQIFRTLFSVMLITGIASCGGKSTGTKSGKDQDSISGAKGDTPEKMDAALLEGNYRGKIGGFTLLIGINYVSGKNISGYNIVRGNRRNIKGTVVQEGNVFKLEMKEPGNDKYDGTFKLTIDPKNNTGNGTWEPNDPKISSALNVTLEKKAPREKPSDYLGEWYGDGLTLNIREDGSVILHGAWYRYSPEKETANTEPVDIKGTWEEKENGKISLEWQKNSVFKTSKVTFYMDTTDMYAITDGREWYFYAY